MYTNYKKYLYCNHLTDQNHSQDIIMLLSIVFKGNGNVEGPTLKNIARVCRQIMRIQNLAAHRN